MQPPATVDSDSNSDRDSDADSDRESDADSERESGPAESSVLGRLDRWQPVLLIGAIIVGLGLARVAPGLAATLGPLVSFGVFTLIYLVMFGADLQGVAGAFSNRSFLIAAVVINFVVNPMMAWGLASVFLQDQPELWAGLILFLVTPCIGWYLVFTELAGGNVSLGVSLLAINVVLQILLLPLYVLLFVGRVVSLEASTVYSSIGVFLIAPLALAAITRLGLGRAGHPADEMQRRIHLPYLKTGVLMVVIVSMFASQADIIFEQPEIVLSLLAPMTAFFALAFAVAVGVGRVMNMPYEQIVPLVFTTTSRNSEASLAIAATVFASPLVPLTVVIGPAIELPLLIIMVRILIRLRVPDRIGL